MKYVIDRRTPEFIKLQNEWYKKLAEKGFQDIEMSGDCHMLRHFDSTRFYRVDAEVFAAQKEYYEAAGRFLYDNHFNDLRAKRIWKAHAAGLGHMEAAKKAGCSMVTAFNTIKRLRAKMLNKLDTVIAVRDGTQQDQAFIYATMLRGVYYGCPQLNLIPKDTFMENYHRLIETVLYLPTTVVKVACLPDDPDCVVGYVLGDSRGIIHFIFVKTAWRKLGIARLLLNSIPNAQWVTHLTHVGERLLKKQRGLRFNPFVMGGSNVG